MDERKRFGLRCFLVFSLLLADRATFASAVLSPLPSPPPGVAQTLKDAFQAALHRSEVVAENQELLVQASELETQAGAALAPTVTGAATFFRQQVPSTLSSVSPAQQNTIKFMADQPLFRGLREYAALRQRKDLKGAQEQALQNVVRQLFYDTATAYYNVLMYASDESNYRNEIEVNRKRLSELQYFYKIGRSQESEMLTFQANISSLETQLEITKGQLETAKDVLAFETGWNRNVTLADNEPALRAENVDSYLTRIEDRADVKNAAMNVEAYEEGVPIARGQHLPNVDLIGDYYATRPGYLSGVNWDVQLAISMTIFQGGAIQSQVRQAQAVARQYDLVLSQVRRTAEEEVRTFYDAWNADHNQTLKLADLVKWSRKNYEAEERDYRNGLVTNLDVLQAITTYQDAQRQLDRVRFLVKLDGAKLQAATEQRPEVAVQPAK